MKIGKQPQIRLNELKKIPVKDMDSNIEKEISKRVEAILAAQEHSFGLGTSVLEQEID